MIAHGADQVASVGETAEPAPRRRVAPLLPLASLVITSSILGLMLLRDGTSVWTFVAALKVLTKVSYLLFLLVFITRPLHDLVKNRATRWLLANRRYLGLTFAVWHLMHWPILGSVLAIAGWARFWKAFGGFLIPAFSVLLVITLLAATSNNASQRFLGKRLWSGIHTVGIYLIWGWFAKVYFLDKVVRTAKPESYVYVYVGLLFAAMALRLVMAVRRQWLRRTVS